MKIREDYLENCKNCVFKDYVYSLNSRALLFSFTDRFVVMDIDPENTYSYDKDKDIFEEFFHTDLLNLEILTKEELDAELNARRTKQDEFKKQQEQQEYLRLKAKFEPS
jgi:hypothetical protein